MLVSGIGINDMFFSRSHCTITVIENGPHPTPTGLLNQFGHPILRYTPKEQMGFVVFRELDDSVEFEGIR